MSTTQSLKTRMLRFTSEKWSFWFLVVSLITGMTFIVVNPPFQAPDEYFHFLRVQSYFEGSLRAGTGPGGTGAILPKSLNTLSEILESRSLQANPDKKQTWSQIRSAFAVPLNPGEQTFLAFPYTAHYAPLSYWPMIISTFVCRLFGLPPLVHLYLGRLSGLVAWCFILAWCIRNIPSGKALLCAMALMPMTLYQASSFSSDGMTNASVILLATMVLMGRMTDTPLRTRQIVLFSVLCIWVALSKYVYWPATLLLWLIPKERFITSRRRLLVCIGIPLGSMLLAFIWIAINHQAAQPLNPLADPVKQIWFIIKHPIAFMLAMARTLKWKLVYLIESFVGRLGYLEVKLPVILYWLYPILLIASLFQRSDSKPHKAHDRVFIYSVGLMMIGLIFLVEYLIWTPVGYDFVAALQGRYFMLPMLLLMLGTGITGRIRETALQGIVLGTGGLGLVMAGWACSHRFFT